MNTINIKVNTGLLPRQSLFQNIVAHMFQHLTAVIFTEESLKFGSCYKPMAEQRNRMAILNLYSELQQQIHTMQYSLTDEHYSDDGVGYLDSSPIEVLAFLGEATAINKKIHELVLAYKEKMNSVIELSLYFDKAESIDKDVVSELNKYVHGHFRFKLYDTSKNELFVSEFLYDEDEEDFIKANLDIKIQSNNKTSDRHHSGMLMA